MILPALTTGLFTTAWRVRCKFTVALRCVKLIFIVLRCLFPADVTTEDGNAILNAHRQVATSEDNKYVITIPKGLNTTRYAYTHELDMIGYTSADVIGEGTEVDLPLYEGEFKFRALAANRQRNTGMRICIVLITTLIQCQSQQMARWTLALAIPETTAPLLVLGGDE